MSVAVDWRDVDVSVLRLGKRRDPATVPQLRLREVALMTKKTVDEVVSVTASFEDAPRRIVEPSVLWFDTFAEAAQAIERCLRVGCTVIVLMETVDHFENDEDPTLDDWPLRHVVRQRHGVGGWEPAE